MKFRNASKILLWLSLCLYLFCLSRSAFSVRAAEQEPLSGSLILFLGWLQTIDIAMVGLFVGLSWFANPIVVITWICLFVSRYRVATYLGAVAVLLSVSFLFGKKAHINSFDADDIISYGVGYWLWIASIGMAFASGLMGRYSESGTAFMSWRAKPAIVCISAAFIYVCAGYISQDEHVEQNTKDVTVSLLAGSTTYSGGYHQADGVGKHAIFSYIGECTHVI